MTALCVVGGGWAGISAAVRGVQSGCDVTLLEMAPQLGGRARRVDTGGPPLDNGQHILIGAYTATLDVMRTVGVNPDDVLHRRPLELVYPDGSGLRLGSGSPLPAFARAVMGVRGWSWFERMGLLRACANWLLARFRCDATLTVAQLTARIPGRVQADLIEPLCVAALNTPSDQASARVFLRVLRDALFSGPGSADLLLPRRTLSDLLPMPAQHWLEGHGARVELGRRVQALGRVGARWHVDGKPFDGVVLACSAHEAARLTCDVHPLWAQAAASFEYEPIVTVYVQTTPGSRLPRPMVALRSDEERPAQFVFDHGRLGGSPGLLAAVSSGARRWAEQGSDASAAAVLRQLREAFPSTWLQDPQVVRVFIDKRATFRCVPGLSRPRARVAEGLWAAGDYVDGPYPATLEGAVRSGQGAIEALLGTKA